MFRPKIQKTSVLVTLASFNLLLVFWALNSYHKYPTFGFEKKNNSVEIMEKAINLLRKEFINKSINSGKDLESFGDFLIGPKKSIVQTTTGSKTSKQSTLNPDFAAVITEMLIELEIDSSDHVAISYTGSYPGANISVLSAIESMQAKPIIISSCGASEFGATNSNFIWIDMENYLYKQNIFSHKSSYASIGGSSDIGSQLSIEGLQICEKSFHNNGIVPLSISDLEKNIENRMNYYETNTQGNEIALFINVGGGIYNTGDSLRRATMPVGIIYPGDIISKSNKTVIDRFLNQDIPVININQIHVLSEWYELPYPPNLRYQYGLGSLFYSKTQYNSLIIFIAFLLSISSVIIIGLISLREINERMYASEPDSIL